MKSRPSRLRLNSDSSGPDDSTLDKEPAAAEDPEQEIPEHLLASPTSRKLAELGDAEDSEEEIVVRRGHEKVVTQGKSQGRTPERPQGQQAVRHERSSVENTVTSGGHGGGRGHQVAEEGSSGEGESGSESEDVGEEQIIGREREESPSAGFDEANPDQVNEEIFADDGPMDMNAAAEELLAMEQAGEGVAGKKKRAIQKRRVLNAKALLDKERGLVSLNKACRKIKFKGKGHEKDDLERLLWTMEHWAHRIKPNLKFEDFLEQAEKLSRKQEIMTFLRSVRAGDKDEELELGANENRDDMMEIDSNALREEEIMLREMSTLQQERFSDGVSGTPMTPVANNALTSTGRGPTPHSAASNVTSVSSGFNLSHLVTSTPFPGATRVMQGDTTPVEAPKLSQEMQDLIEQKKQMALARRRERLAQQQMLQNGNNAVETSAPTEL